MNLPSSVTAISEVLAILLEPNSVAELRAIGTPWGTVSGYFDNQTLLAKAASDLSGKVSGVYVTLNPVGPDLLARAVNRVIRHAKNTTSDADIQLRRWFAIDLDPFRPAGISATEAEHQAALDRSRQCKNWLQARGWPDPIVADSGNGGHLLYRLDLANEPANAELVKQCLQALGLRFSDEQVVVDLSTYNAARIWKVYGTLAAKGDSTPERPHRYARLLEVPSSVEIVNTVQLTALAATLPQAPKGHDEKCSFDLAAWLSQYEIPVVAEAPWNGGHKWIVNPCPWNPEHTNKSAYVVQLPSGAIGAGCHHASCADKDWVSLRALFDLEHPVAPNAPDTDQGTGPGQRQDQEKVTQVKRLLALGAEVELFHTPDGEPYATLPVNGHYENWPLRNRRFRQWLLRLYYRETQGAPKSQALQEAIGVFESKANFEGPECPVFMRLAETDGRIYLDLANDAWEAVEIGPTGWRLLSSVPVKFRRTRGMSPLPYPVRGGGINQLRRFLNFANQQDWILLAEWLVAACRPRGPYPVLVLHGEQGSAKSTTSRVLRSLLDPNTAPLRGEPRDLRDVMITASNGWVISLDNLSRIPSWLSDALCRLATGGGFSTRELYTDSEEVLFDAQRPVILNGIEELATRGDLLDRALILYLPSVPQEKREPEGKFWSEFELARPDILGALLDVVSGALARLPEVELSKKPRLADFAVWATAAEPLLDLPHGDFMRAYAQNQSSANDLALEASPVAAVLQALARAGTFEGTATELLKDLTDHADESARSQRSWPANAQGLSNTLRRLAPNLRNCGIDVSFARGANRQRRRLISVRDLASTSSTAPTSQIPPLAGHGLISASCGASGHGAAPENFSDADDQNGTLDDVDALDVRTQPCGPEAFVADAATSAIASESCSAGRRSHGA